MLFSLDTLIPNHQRCSLLSMSSVSIGGEQPGGYEMEMYDCAKLGTREVCQLLLYDIH